MQREKRSGLPDGELPSVGITQNKHSQLLHHMFSDSISMEFLCMYNHSLHWRFWLLLKTEVHIHRGIYHTANSCH